MNWEEKKLKLEKLKQEIAEYKEFHRTKYSHVKRTNDELEKEIKALEYLADKQESNVRTIIRQKLLAKEKNLLLLSNLDEALSARKYLTLTSDQIARVDPARYQAKATRLKQQLDESLQEEMALAKQLVRLETESAELERHCGAPPIEGVVPNCDWGVQDWTQKVTKFEGITKLYEYLVNDWATRGAAHRDLDEALVQELVERELERINNPEDHKTRSSLTLASSSQSSDHLTLLTKEAGVTKEFLYDDRGWEGGI